MKRLLLLTAALLLGSLAHSQEADDLGKYAEVTLIPRLDANLAMPSGSSSDDPASFTLGNSSFYTLFEGALSEHFSWTVVNHWLSSSAPGDLYGFLGRSDENSMLDYACVDLSYGNWNFNLGKSSLKFGWFEGCPWDWEADTDIASSVWNALVVYQWGAAASYTTNSGMSTFTAQMATSPYGKHPFSSGLYVYNANWEGEYGPFRNLWSAAAIQQAPGQYQWLFTLGQQVDLGDFTLGLDWANKFGFDDEIDGEYVILVPGYTINATIDYAPSERFEVGAKAVLQASRLEETETWNVFGAYGHWYPLRESRDLRVHASFGIGEYVGGVSATIGILYNFTLPRR